MASLITYQVPCIFFSKNNKDNRKRIIQENYILNFTGINVAALLLLFRLYLLPQFKALINGPCKAARFKVSDYICFDRSVSDVFAVSFLYDVPVKIESGHMLCESSIDRRLIVGCNSICDCLVI